MMNSWSFTKEPVNDIGSVLNNEFYLQLFKELGKEEYYQDDKPLSKSVEEYLKDEYQGFEVTSNPWSDVETILVTSLVLFSASLKSHNLRTPLFQLPRTTQLSIQAFFQKLISKPTQEVNNEILLEVINDISDDENDVLDSLPKTPILRFKSNLQETPEWKRHESAKVKSLECKLDLVEWEKQHLQEEVELLKKDLDDLRKKYNVKEQDVLKLESELYICKSKDEDTIEANAVMVKAKHEENRLKAQICDMEKAMETIRTDLYRALTSNSTLESQLERSEEREEESEKNCMQLESKVEMLTLYVQELESMVSNLKQTTKEQSELLLEKTSYKTLNESLASIEADGETLATVVEMKYLEAESQLCSLRAELRECVEEKEELVKTVEYLQKVINSREDEDKEEFIRLKTKLMETSNSLEEQREENEFLMLSLEEKKSENEQLIKDLEILKGSEVISNEVDFKSSSDSGIKTDMLHDEPNKEKLQSEITHLNSLLDGKQCVLEETKGYINKLKREISRSDRELSSLMEDLSLTKSKLSKAQQKVCELNKELMEKNMEISQLNGEISKCKAENSMIKGRIRSVELEAENLKGDLRVKDTTVLALEQNLNMHDHEKAILERRICFLKADADQVNQMKSEIQMLKKEIAKLGEDLSSQRTEKEQLKVQIEEKEKSCKFMENKLASLETEMQNKYEEALQNATSEYAIKINHLKKKMIKDKTHIEELSSELWETCDRYLLASQESKALRGQLQRTRAALELLTNTQPMTSQRSNPCLWLEEENFDERLTYTREIWGRRYSFTSNKGVIDNDQEHIDDDEVFNDACLEDLKAGVCRLPTNPLPLASRASYPVPRTSEMSMGKTSDRQSLLINEKPKKIKTGISYSRPGPPTPVRNRLSLQGLDRMEKVVNENEKIMRESQGPLSFSRFFNKRNQNKIKPVQVSPKVRRKSFFQRKFGSNRENIPPN
ncbi:centromere-associated protein E-like isoform X2 [Cimex lectularius]|uniref:Uncharacterized protein n=1 Tax=Cimex lectularius TaxID=79782 RepID=A0A8I6RXX0_CIMLE|nr:centromere-associated protein E-like isoform X2 [Cimex lectularius]